MLVHSGLKRKAPKDLIKQNNEHKYGQIRVSLDVNALQDKRNDFDHSIITYIMM